MNKYEELSIDDYERVIFCENNEVKLKSFIAIHSTKMGPALGGCRLWNYDSKEEALTDALRLSKGMTYKNALAGLKLGGGKSIIWGKEKTPELFEAMGEFVEYVGGKYIIAEDVGINYHDIKIMANKTKYTVNLSLKDPGPITAQGVYAGILAACKFKYNTSNLRDLKIAVQGIGSVGLSLIKLLLNDGAMVFAADINRNNLNKARSLGAITISSTDIHTIPGCNIFAPCAMGGFLNDNTIPQLTCDIVAGSANNQLLEETHGQKLFDRKILYAPDFVINAGGVIMVSAGTKNGFNTDEMINKVNNIGNTLLDIFNKSKNNKLPTNVIANNMAEEILR